MNKYKQVAKKFARRKTAMAGLIVIAVLIILIVFGKFIVPFDPYMMDPTCKSAAPSAVHLFGTDNMGRDMLSRVIDGARVTLIISITSVAISLVLGTILGLLSGYLGGAVDRMVMRIVEALSSFPMILLALVISTILGSGIKNVIIAIGLAYTPAFIRVIRSMTLTVKECEYIQSAVAAGLTRTQILVRYILPNVSSVIIVQTSLSAAQAILSEASMGYIGVGVQAPEASWGSMLKAGYNFMETAPWMSIFPGIAIVLTVLALNFIGDGLRDALDVRLRND